MEEIRDATLGMTLSEIRERDIDNLKLVCQSAKKYIFETVPAAKAFINKALTMALMKFGIDVKKLKKLYPEDYERHIHNECAAKQVILEPKPRVRTGEHFWRSGVYMYYRNEIAFFISLPQRISKSQHIITLGDEYRYMIVTNVK